MMLLLAAACTPAPVCGPGTTLVDGACTVAATGADPTDPTDSVGPPTDSGTPPTDSGTPPVQPLQVYILAGQSNMDGYAYGTGLPPSMQIADPRVPLFWSGWGEFRSLAPSSYGGAVFAGPEVPLGHTLADAGVPAVLVKHAVGGTDLASYWYPGATPDAADAGPGFSVLVDTMEAAAAALDAAGTPWTWAGFVWMQGESDALDAGKSAAYEANLTRLIASVRAVSGEPALPAAIGLISRESIWTYTDTVRSAQQAVADADPAVVTVESDDLPRNELDLAHYDGPSNRVLGARFARALLTGVDVPAGTDAPVALFTVESGATDYDFTGTCGFSFTLSGPVEVTDLGAYGSQYLYTSADVGIWDEEGNLLLRGNVPSWYDAPASWRDSLWFVAVDPVRLDAGTYRIGLVSWTGDVDRYLNDAQGHFAEGVRYGAGVYAEGYWLTYPANSVVTEGVSFVGPGLLFVPAD